MTVMSLEDVFPEDPWLPSLRYAASTLVPFTLPWDAKPIKLGTGFHSKLATRTSPFAAKCAFDTKFMKAIPPKFFSESAGSYAELKSSYGSHAQEHLNFSLAASAKVLVVSASGQAKFESHAAVNADGIKSSIANRILAGRIGFDVIPPLSPEAQQAAWDGRNEGGADKFEELYGDYYVSALRIGAANATELSAGSTSNYTSEAKSWSVTVTVKVLCWKASVTKSGSSSKSSYSTSGTVKFNGYDTLSMSQSNDSGNDIAAYDRIVSVANTSLRNAQLLQGRLATATRTFHLVDGGAVTNEQAEIMAKAGLVLEIELLPYAKLRDYISSRTR